MRKLSFASAYYPFWGKLLFAPCTFDGIDLTWSHVHPPGVLFRQVIEFEPYDLAEMSLSSYTMLREAGWTSYQALPIFTLRCFRHSAIFVREESNIVDPGGLAGKRIGVPEYHMTAAVWVRGILAEDFGLEPDKMQWFTGGAEVPGRKERVELPQQLRALVSPIGSGETLFGLLLKGDLDAVIATQVPELLSAKPAPIRRLFRNWMEVEKEYYRKHRIFPIMHTVALRRSVCDNDREVPRKLYRALEGLKREFYGKVDLARNISAFPWLDFYIGEISELMEQDPWPFGMEPNARALEKFMEYAWQQGLIHRKPELAELFLDFDH